MPTSVIAHIRRLVCDGPRDDELLGHFIERARRTALAALVNRHGPMVWGVCRRHLSHHDAEDAFQATFVVLARKASSIAHRETVGNWLYGVAHQTALQRGEPLAGGGKCRWRCPMSKRHRTSGLTFVPSWTRS